MNLTQSILDYADNAGITHSYPGPYRVTTEWLNIRKFPGTGSVPIVGHLEEGDEVMVLDRVGSWCQIEQGWIYNYLEAI